MNSEISDHYHCSSSDIRKSPKLEMFNKAPDRNHPFGTRKVFECHPTDVLIMRKMTCIFSVLKLLS